jgi:hypothetical protein
MAFRPLTEKLAERETEGSLPTTILEQTVFIRGRLGICYQISGRETAEMRTAHCLGFGAV